MKIIYHITAIAILLSACQSEKTPDSSVNSIDNVNQVETDSANNKQKEDRTYWQKPDLVLGKLGKLDDKVIADIGAGMGYFSFELSKRKAKKVIAIDIDEEMIKTLNYFKNLMEEKESYFGDRFEVRKATSDDPNIKQDEVDIILIVNTIAYINPKVKYLKKLHNNLKDGGQIIIVDFKTKKIPEDVNPPPYSNRVYLHEIEEVLEESGFSSIVSDDMSLEYQYIVVAQK